MKRTLVTLVMIAVGGMAFARYAADSEVELSPPTSSLQSEVRTSSNGPTTPGGRGDVDVSPMQSFGALAISDYGSLPASRFPPAGWSDVEPFSTTGFTLVDVTKASDVGSANVITPNSTAIDTAEKVEAIVASSTAPRILFFPAGTYYMQTDLAVTRSNVVLRGAGQGVTTLQISAPSTANAEVRFDGPGLGAEVDVTNAPVRGDSAVSASTAGLAVGDVVQIYDASLGLAYGRRNYSQLAKVSSLGTATVGLDMLLGLSFTNPKLREVGVIRNVGIEKLTVFRDKAASAPDTHNIHFRHVAGAFANDVEASYLERGGITLNYVIDAAVKNSRIHHAYDYGVGGQAYGILASNTTTRCAIVNNKAWSLRHQIQLTFGANHCVVAFNSSEPPYIGTTNDLNQHGFSPHNNLWEGNMGLKLASDDRAEVDAQEYAGLYNVYYRNRTLGSGNATNILATSVGGNFPYYFPTVIGNVTGSIWIGSDVTSPYVGNNRVNGSVVLGNAAAGGTYPPSLYRTTKPTFLGTKPWPIFGPNVGTDFGATNVLPAFEQSQSPIAGIVVDDGDAGYQDSGNWTVSTAGGGYNGDYKQDGATAAGRWATFRSDGKAAGRYRVYVFWKAYSNRATNATVRVYHANGAFTNAGGRYDDFVVNQQLGDQANGQFNAVGGVFTMSSTDYVGILNTGANGYVIADAVKWTPE